VFGGGENPDLELLGSQLTLETNDLPAGSVTGGALSQAGTLSGTDAITYNAQDIYTGVRLVQLLLDGKPFAEHDLITECPYEDFAACPTTVSGELQLNTTKVSNGTHELGVRIINAAGNATIIDEHPVTVNNQPVQPNTAPTPAHIANGQPCAGEELNLEVNGVQNRTLLTLYGRTITVRGVLHCGTVPVRDGQIVINSLAGPPITTSVQTAVDGSFTYTVPTGADRTLQFAYTAYSDDPGPSATAIATIAIRPKITLKIKPRATSNGHTIYWTGKVVGPPYPTQGITLNVEVREGRHWRIFDQLVTSSKGQFHYHYRFHATNEPTTYTFRVALPDNGSQGYAYTPGPSNIIRVHVNP